MATYQFSNITAAQANAYDAAADDLSFEGVSGATAADFSVVLSVDRYVFRSTSGANINFGPGAAGEMITFADGSRLAFPSAGAATANGGAANDQLFGGAAADQLNGFAGDDQLFGGAGGDTLYGGTGRDIMNGGSEGLAPSANGRDIFLFSVGDSGVDEASMDEVVGWGAGDVLKILAPIKPAAYEEFVLASYADALDRANQQIAAGVDDVVAVQVDGDVYVFVDSRADNGAADDIIRLKATDLSAISAASLATGPVSSAPVPTGTSTGGDGPDTLVAPATGNATLSGGGGDDSISAGSGDDSVTGGTGNDTIAGVAGTNYLRGDDGNDSIVGGSGFDDINGNQGNDTCVSGGGDDWVVGGKDNDSLTGSDGQNLVYGNLGDDTCDGGAGNDIVRGGQGNDIVKGGAGDDFVSGDKGDDTITGGAGADSFHTFGDAGIDRVLDFSRAEGDRVQLDPGTQYTVAQVGADTVISMTGGGQMTLVGVSMSTLTGDWIFGA